MQVCVLLSSKMTDKFAYFKNFSYLCTEILQEHSIGRVPLCSRCKRSQLKHTIGPVCLLRMGLFVEQSNNCNMNVVLLCRVSTNHQDYNRQINELTEFCHHQGWTIERIFANKVSGKLKNEERAEIQEMISYVRTHSIDKVVVLEISRLGRNTLEALKVIQELNEQGICLYVKNYNLETIIDGKVNPVASLICTILLEIAQMERLTIVERMESGRKQYIQRCREEGKKMGRPSTYRKSDEAYKAQYVKELSLMRKGGISLRNIEKLTGTSVKTLQKLRDMYLRVS